MNEVTNYRDILEPVHDFYVTARHQPPVRYRRPLDYVKTDRRYLIELRFPTDIDLALFEKFIEGTTIRLMEYQPTGRTRARVFVTDTRIDETRGWDPVWQWVEEELPRIGTAIALRFPQFNLPQCRCIIDLRAEGGHMMVVTKPVKVKVAGTSSMPSFADIMREKSLGLSEFLAKCQADADFAEAAMCCGQALDAEAANPWASLYRAYEVVADKFGGDKELVRCCCSKNQLERFNSPWIKSRFGQASAGSNFACERLQGADNRI